MSDGGRLTAALETRTEPRTLAESTGSDWAGFPLMARRSGNAGRSLGVEFPTYWLAVVVRGSCAVKLRSAGKERRLTFSSGHFAGYPAGQHWDDLEYRGSVESINVSCDWSALKDTRLSESEATPSLAAIYACVADEGITAICKSMLQEILAGCPSGRVYAESLSLALASRLDGISRACAGRRVLGARNGRLGVARSLSLEEYIAESLAEDISISQLASVAGLSPSHFAASFRRTFGVTAHRYIVEQRIDKAKSMLRRDRSIAEIALDCGFSSQSHFAEAFRRATGLTPGEYRRDG